MLQESFVMAVSSGDSKSIYPENRHNDFTVRLANPKALVGDWEVALAEISFPYEWYTMENVIGVHIISSMIEIDGDINGLGDMLCAKPRPPPETGWFYEVDLLYGAPTNYFQYRYVELPAGEYTSPQDLGNMLAKIVQLALAQTYNLSETDRLFNYVYDSDTNTGKYEIVHDQLNVCLVLEHSKLATTLGLTHRRVFPVVVTNNVKSSRNEIVSFTLPNYRPVYFLTGESGFSTQRETVHVYDVDVDSIYIYSDIIEPQYVGDVLAPLLGIAPLRVERGSRQVFTFKQPVYLPLSRNQFHTVHVKLRSSQAKPIPFPQQSSNVHVLLHFRRCSRFNI
jgi:hypothetical protein